LGQLGELRVCRWWWWGRGLHLPGVVEEHPTHPTGLLYHLHLAGADAPDEALHPARMAVMVGVVDGQRVAQQ
jgi:hypothetical protein